MLTKQSIASNTSVCKSKSIIVEAIFEQEDGVAGVTVIAGSSPVH
jgi:hypothetical protein